MRYDHVIHLIPEYKVSKQGQIFSNIICKYNKIKRSIPNGSSFRRRIESVKVPLDKKRTVSL